MGWAEHVGRVPSADDFLFVRPDGQPFREESSEVLLADVRRLALPTSPKGRPLDIYSFRHSFATIARRAGIASEDRSRLMGHRPGDTKALHYEDDDIALLASAIEKIPATLLDDAMSPLTVSASTTDTAIAMDSATALDDAGAAVPNGHPVVSVVVAPPAVATGAQSVSLMISAEEERFELPVDVNPRRFSKPLP